MKQREVAGTSFVLVFSLHLFDSTITMNHMNIIIIIINTIVVIMFLALKGVGVIVLHGEPADGKRTP
jgi:hypothetical protein